VTIAGVGSFFPVARAVPTGTRSTATISSQPTADTVVLSFGAAASSPLTADDIRTIGTATEAEVNIADDGTENWSNDDAQRLADRIAADRAAGVLTGKADYNYLGGILQTEVQDLRHSPSIPYVTLHNAQRAALMMDGKSCPPQLVATDRPGVYTSPTEAGKITYINEALTTSDKAFLMKLNGGQLDGGGDDFGQLKTTIALSRAIGTLTGDLTRDFLTTLIAQTSRDLAFNKNQSPPVSLPFLEKALACFDSMNTQTGRPMT
jgi:hypothetical protein